MIDRKKLKESQKLIAIGGFFVLLAGVLGVYYYLNQPPTVNYDIEENVQYTTIPLIEDSNDQEDLEEKIETDFRVVIGKINLDAPVIINVDGNNEDEYLASLQDGVAHLKGTAIFGDKGNAFLFGHSSYYLYDPGEYKDVFAKLNELAIGDEVTIDSNLNTYRYEIFEIKEVDPDEVDVVNKIDGEDETLTLMTCTPRYTTLRRLIIVAGRIK